MDEFVDGASGAQDGWQAWHRRVALDLVAQGTKPKTISEGPTRLEIAFGQARTAFAYVLEFARAHRIAASGTLGGDDITFKLGRGRARFTLNRREGHIAVHRPGREDTYARWDEDRRSIVDRRGAEVDIGASAREAVDALVADWARDAPSTRAPADFDDDVPTKG
ncbi:MAG TPA: hypothetical protein VKU41_21920 [Polyangiaceae bacterium]|nr:hypothetical protein [Polyangiaceae bacterium]